METIKEDYVSFETAILLKEKGFDERCDYAYNSKAGYFEVDRSNFDEVYCFRPSLAMAMKWLRRVYNINIDIVSVWNQKRFEYQVFIVTPENAKHCYVDDKLYLGYEEAVEAAIKYCLEHLI